MRATRLIAVLVAIAAIAIIAADAQAVYHPTMGRFLQRDPGAGGGSPARTGTAGPAVGGGFIPRDPMGSNQYADGMSLYEYARSNPLGYVDPDGRVVVVISGLGQHHNNGQPLVDAIAERIIAEVGAGGFDTNEMIRVQMVMGGWGWAIGDTTLRSEYDKFLKRKNDNPCSLEQFVAVGHSDGATAMYHGLRDGGFDKDFTPAYLGLIDIVRTQYGFLGTDILTVNTDPNGSVTISKPEGTTVHNFRQTAGRPSGWIGRIVNGADLNVDVNRDWGPWYAVENGELTDHVVQLDHFSIFANREVHEQIGWRAAGAYIGRVMSSSRPKPWARKAGEHW